MDEREVTVQETAGEMTGGTAPDAGEKGAAGEESFEALIRGRYKGEFDARVRKILDGRLRGLRQENERLRAAAAEAEVVRRYRRRSSCDRPWPLPSTGRGSRWRAPSPAAAAAWRRTAADAGASAVGTPGD